MGSGSWRCSADGTGSALTSAFRSHRGVIDIFSNIVIIVIIKFSLIVRVINTIVTVVVIVIGITVSYICLPVCWVTCRERTFYECASTGCKVYICECIAIEWENATLGPGFLDGFW
jgi:uncharacterized membrane protein